MFTSIYLIPSRLVVFCFNPLLSIELCCCCYPPPAPSLLLSLFLMLQWKFFHIRSFLFTFSRFSSYHLSSFLTRNNSKFSTTICSMLMSFCVKQNTQNKQPNKLWNTNIKLRADDRKTKSKLKPSKTRKTKSPNWINPSVVRSSNASNPPNPRRPSETERRQTALGLEENLLGINKYHCAEGKCSSLFCCWPSSFVVRLALFVFGSFYHFTSLHVFFFIRSSDFILTWSNFVFAFLPGSW